MALAGRFPHDTPALSAVGGRRDLRLPARSAQDPALRLVLDEAVRLELADDIEDFLRYQQGAEDPEWADAVLTSRGVARVPLPRLGGNEELPGTGAPMPAV